MTDAVPEFLRDIGAHHEAIETLKDEVRAMRKELSEIKVLLSEAKGGILMLVGVGSIGGAVGAAVMKFIWFIKGGA